MWAHLPVRSIGDISYVRRRAGALIEIKGPYGPVQPMKAASAAVLIEPIGPAAIAGAGPVIGAFFLVFGLTGFANRLARTMPGTIAAEPQLGLGLSLAGLGSRLNDDGLFLSSTTAQPG